MSCAVTTRRLHAALSALAVLTFIAVMALVSPPGQAANELNITIEMKVTVKSDDNFEASFVITDQTDYSVVPPITEGSCTLNYFLLEPNIFANAETKFDDGKDKRVCTITRKGKISETNGAISHKDGEYAIDTTSLNDRKTPPPEMRLFYTATFPGQVTQSDGGEVEGNERNTVSFTDFTGRVVKGKDRPASALTTSKLLPWIIGGVGSLVVIGLITMAVVVRRRQRSSPPRPGPHPQAFPVPGPASQVFHPNQPEPQQFPAQSTPHHPYQQQYQQYLGQPSQPSAPDGTGDSTYPPVPTQAPPQHSGWPPPQQPQ